MLNVRFEKKPHFMPANCLRSALAASIRFLHRNATASNSVLSLVAIAVSVAALLYAREASNPNVSLKAATGQSYYSSIGTIDGEAMTTTKFFITVRNTGGRATTVEDIELVSASLSQLGADLGVPNPVKPVTVIRCIDPATLDSMLPFHRVMQAKVKCDFRKRVDTGEASDFPFEFQIVNPSKDTRVNLDATMSFRFSDGSVHSVNVKLTSPSPREVINAGYGN